MVLGSFQCRGVLLLLHIVGQGPAVLAAGAGRVGYIFYIYHLSFISYVLSFWETAEHDWNIVVSAVNRLDGLSLPRNSTIIKWQARHGLVVDWAVKPQQKIIKDI